MNPLSHVSIQDAPRDAGQLEKIGRFQRRNLADQLGLLQDADARAAFMALNDAAQAQALATQLKAHDESGGATKANGISHAAPAQAPAAQAPPAQAVATAPTGLRRQPRNSTTAAAAAAAVGEPQATQAPQQPGVTTMAANVDLTPVLTALQAVLKNQTDILTVLKNQGQELDYIKYTNGVTVATMLTMAEQTFGDGSDDFREKVINSALEDTEGVQAYLEEALGKARAKK
jgi:hypothetical protein